jgi:NADH-ubiquinone oxidoreductase chain 3
LNYNYNLKVSGRVRQGPFKPSTVLINSCLILVLSVITIFIILMLSLTITSFSIAGGEKNLKDSPFECGVLLNQSSRKPYSLPFFIITVIFLMFDVEIILLFPIFYFYLFRLRYIFYSLIIFLLLIGIFLEWFYGSLH